MKMGTRIATLLSFALLVGCGAVGSSVYQDDLKTDSGEPAYITVQHCLIGFQGSVPGAMRSMEEARTLAYDLLERARNGEDFDEIVYRNTNDSPPGIYRMANHGFESDMSASNPDDQIYARDKMVPAFGDTGFPLKVGEYGIADFDEEKSPFGFHIVKRIR